MFFFLDQLIENWSILENTNLFTQTCQLSTFKRTLHYTTTFCLVFFVRVEFMIPVVLFDSPFPSPLSDVLLWFNALAVCQNDINSSLMQTELYKKQALKKKHKGKSDYCHPFIRTYLLFASKSRELIVSFCSELLWSCLSWSRSHFTRPNSAVKLSIF